MRTTTQTTMQAEMQTTTHKTTQTTITTAQTITIQETTTNSLGDRKRGLFCFATAPTQHAYGAVQEFASKLLLT